MSAPNALETVLTYAQYAALVAVVSYLARIAWHALRRGWWWLRVQRMALQLGRDAYDWHQRDVTMIPCANPLLRQMGNSWSEPVRFKLVDRGKYHELILKTLDAPVEPLTDEEIDRIMQNPVPDGDDA